MAFSKTLAVCSPPELNAFALEKSEILSQFSRISSAFASSPRLNPSDSIIFDTEYTPAPAQRMVPFGAFSETKYIAAGVTLSGVNSC
jgi:hypothetical protein